MEAPGKFLAFEYTDEQWAEIERSLHHLLPSQTDLEKARGRLGRAARSCRQEMANAPREKSRMASLERDWARIGRLSDELMRLLLRVGELEPVPPNSNGGPTPDFMRDKKLALMKLTVFARGRLDTYKIDYGFPQGDRAYGSNFACWKHGPA